MDKVLERYWANVDTTNNCWLWTGRLTVKGYGSFVVTYNGYKFWRAPRFAWFLENGPIPKDGQILHTCDNRFCVNPEHLYLGNTDDNMRDMVKNGRSMIGERHWKARLTEDDVIAIRLSNKSDSQLAAKYNVHASHIGKIRIGVRWGHVPMPERVPRRLKQ